ncbi:MAG: OsmC family peroxiredoxin [Streptosporangiales bacterium]|nr:OsmC family peroxiredoxin [Streptosporangiales bacterium]
MSSAVAGRADTDEGFIRRKALIAHNDATMRTVVDAGEYGTFTMDEPEAHGGTGAGPSPLQTVLGALCGCEAVTFYRTAAEYGFSYTSIDFEGSFTIDIRGRSGDRAVRPHFRTVRVRAIVVTEEPIERLAEVVEETEARCPVFNLVRDADVDVAVQWVHEPPT